MGFERIVIGAAQLITTSPAPTIMPPTTGEDTAPTKRADAGRRMTGESAATASMAACLHLLTVVREEAGLNAIARRCSVAPDEAFCATVEPRETPGRPRVQPATPHLALGGARPPAGAGQPYARPEPERRLVARGRGRSEAEGRARGPHLHSRGRDRAAGGGGERVPARGGRRRRAERTHREHRI